MPKDEKLKRFREEIDALDDQLLELISKRAECVRQVGEHKREQDPDPDYCRLEREAQIKRRIREKNPGPLSDEDVAQLFQELISACFSLETGINVAYLGPAGTFTHAAAKKHFGHKVSRTACVDIAQVFRRVAAKVCDYGVVPVENSTEGAVSHTLDMFLESDLHICGEVQLPVHHHLSGATDGLAGVQRLYSHPQSFAQCRIWLDAHARELRRVEVSSNGEAARQAAEDPQGAAICGAAAAAIYGLSVLEKNIEDNPDNTTRFLVIGREFLPPSGDDKTTILFSSPNRAGSLHDMLECLARHGVGMTRIESRPSKQEKWEYVFFADLMGHAEEPGIKRALRDLEKDGVMLKRLGSYPKAF